MFSALLLQPAWQLERAAGHTCGLVSVGYFASSDRAAIKNPETQMR